MSNRDWVFGICVSHGFHQTMTYPNLLSMFTYPYFFTMDFLTKQKIQSLLSRAVQSRDMTSFDQICADHNVLPESFGVTLKVYLTITKGKSGLDIGCRRFLNLECENFSQMHVFKKNPLLAKDIVDEVFDEWSQEEKIVIDSSLSEIKFDDFYFNLSQSNTVFSF